MASRVSLRAGWLALAVLVSAAAPAAAEDWVQAPAQGVHSPSSNIHCGFVDPGIPDAPLMCEIWDADWEVETRRIPDCEFDEVRSLRMGPIGGVELFVDCTSDTWYGPAMQTLPYGQAWALGAFRCLSEATGMTCTNADGHGWHVSRGSVRIF